MQISVIGNSEEMENRETARQTGFEIGKKGHILICGGRTGVMEAACRGAKEAGGLTIGISTTADGSELNSHVDIKINTGLGYARNAIVAYSADAVIAIGGSHGTLNEMCFASFAGKPIICIKGSGGWSDLLEGKSIDLTKEKQVHSVETPAEAVELAEKLDRSGKTGQKGGNPKEMRERLS